MAERNVRVRLAPSPTGALHVGGVHTTLYNYLFAHQHGGKLIFHTEDTDSNRFVPGAEEYILDSFDWLGIKFDEGVGFGGGHGPYRQSEHRDIYKKYVNQLLEAGKAYIAFDTPEELDARCKEIENFQYDVHTRLQMHNSLTMSKEEVEGLIEDGQQYVIHFKVEPGEEIHIKDMIHGDVYIKSDTLDNRVLSKSADELSTYHLANVVDDRLIEISHIIRGEEWLPGAPLHVLLYRAFGWKESIPRFAHLSLLLKPEDKGKLSKRDGDRLGLPIFPLKWHDPKTGEVNSGYRESDYFPEAIVNFLALLGWNPGTEQELFSPEELMEASDIIKCSKSGTEFGYKEGIWFNHGYILCKSDDKTAQLLAPIVANNGAETTVEQVTQVMHMMKDHVGFIKELQDLRSFFFTAPTSCDEKTVRKRQKDYPAQQMSKLVDVLEGVDDFDIESQEPVVMRWAEDRGCRLGDIMNTFRLSLVGIGKGPEMFDVSVSLGKEETLKRMCRVIEVLG